jgi:hypothetical protein
MTSEVKEEVQEVIDKVFVPKVGMSRLEEETPEVNEEVRNLKIEV